MTVERGLLPRSRSRARHDRRWLLAYASASELPSGYVLESARLSWAVGDPVGELGFCRAHAGMDWAASAPGTACTISGASKWRLLKSSLARSLKFAAKAFRIMASVCGAASCRGALNAALTSENLRQALKDAKVAQHLLVIIFITMRRLPRMATAPKNARHTIA